jgi:hypothetical protein
MRCAFDPVAEQSSPIILGCLVSASVSMCGKIARAIARRSGWSSLATRSLWRVRRRAESQEALGAYAPLHLPPLEEQAHLFVVPRTQAVRTKKTTHVSHWSIAGCQQVPGIRFHSSSQQARPRSSSLAARSLTAGLSAPL